MQTAALQKKESEKSSGLSASPQQENSVDEESENIHEALTPLFLQRFASSPTLPSIQRYPDDDLDAGPDRRTDAGADDYGLSQFMSHDYLSENFRPTAGRGAFRAFYDPSRGRLMITVYLHFVFRGPTSQHSGNPDYEWQPSEEASYQHNACQIIREVWSGRHRFHCTRENWEALPDVNVEVEVTPIFSEQNAHYVFYINKYPQRQLGQNSSATTRDLRTENRPFGTINLRESMEGGIENPDIQNNDIDPAFPEYQAIRDANPRYIYFSPGSSELSSENETSLDGFASILGQRGMPGFPVEINGFSCNEEITQGHTGLSEDRARIVYEFLTRSSSQSSFEYHGQDGAGDDPLWQCTEIIVRPYSVRQRALLHEFGHVIGLGDEYTARSGGISVGTEARHSDLAERLIPGQQPVMAMQSDSVMSVGEVIQPWHYVTFLEALESITGIEGEWEVGPGPGARAILGDLESPQ